LILVNSTADLHHNHDTFEDNDDDCPVLILKTNPSDIGIINIGLIKQAGIFHKEINSEFICSFTFIYQAVSSRAPPLI
jgi:hypothetical protein